METIVTEIAQIKEAVGWRNVLRAVDTNLELARWIETKRAPRQMATSLFKALELSAAVQWHIVPKSTYHKSEHLSILATERLIRVARVFARAINVFGGDVAAARAFLSRPHALLSDKAPAELAISEPGAREVESLLQDIELGLPV
jgi:putative toxin-antitoxin system antitoxin component (TIGR02293 family)